jgi:anti-sigma B factor antagonist
MATDEIFDARAWWFAIRVARTSDPDQVRLEFTGELDILAASVARDRITELRQGRELVLDLRGLSFIDPSGVHLLLELAADAKQDRWNLSLIPGPRRVQRIFQLTETEEGLPFTQVEEGLPFFEATRPREGAPGAWVGGQNADRAEAGRAR